MKNRFFCYVTTYLRFFWAFLLNLGLFSLFLIRFYYWTCLVIQKLRNIMVIIKI